MYNCPLGFPDGLSDFGQLLELWVQVARAKQSQAGVASTTDKWVEANLPKANYSQMPPTSGFDMCFAIGSQHRYSADGCCGPQPNTHLKSSVRTCYSPRCNFLFGLSGSCACKFHAWATAERDGQHPAGQRLPWLDMGAGRARHVSFA